MTCHGRYLTELLQPQKHAPGACVKPLLQRNLAKTTETKMAETCGNQLHGVRVE